MGSENPNDRCFYREPQEDGSSIPCNKKRHSHPMYARHHPFTEAAGSRDPEWEAIYEGRIPR